MTDFQGADMGKTSNPGEQPVDLLTALQRSLDAARAERGRAVDTELRAEVERLHEEVHAGNQRGDSLNQAAEEYRLEVIDQRARAAAAEAELERLRESYNHRVAECRRWRDEQGRIVAAQRAAERALAEERAKVARVEAEVARHRAFGNLSLREQIETLSSPGQIVEAFAAALAGPAPEATE